MGWVFQHVLSDIADTLYGIRHGSCVLRYIVKISWSGNRGRALRSGLKNGAKRDSLFVFNVIRGLGCFGRCWRGLRGRLGRGDGFCCWFVRGACRSGMR